MRYFNKRLKVECSKYGFRFFDVYEQYADRDGFLSSEYSDGNVHIGNGIWLDKFIADLNLKPFRCSQINLPEQRQDSKCLESTLFASCCRFFSSWADPSLVR